jgi:hypothetical protein
LRAAHNSPGARDTRPKTDIALVRLADLKAWKAGTANLGGGKHH